MLFVSVCPSGGGTVRVLPAVLHGQSGEQAVLPFPTHQHHQRADTHTGLVLFSLDLQITPLFAPTHCMVNHTQHFTEFFCKFACLDD